MPLQRDGLRAAHPTVPVERRNLIAVERGRAAQPSGQRSDRLAAELAPVVVEHLLVGQDRVEDADDAHVEAVVAVVRHRHRLGEALGLVVARRGGRPG